VIAYVKPIPGVQKGGFMALRMVRGGVCVPITGEVEESRENAVQTCIQDLWSHLEDLMDHVRDEFSMIQANMLRMHDRVQHSDQVRIAGVWQTPDDDGLVMPKRRSTAWFPGRADRAPIAINASLYPVLHAALNLRGSSDDPAEVMLDQALNQPAELLARVAEDYPDRLAEVARFIVQVFEAQRDHDPTRDVAVHSQS